MIQMLTIDEILELLKKTPEQAVYDWKSDFIPPSDQEKQGELLKDLTAIANSSPLSPGFIVYGVDPRKSDPILGVTNQYDDSRIQQFMKGKVEPDIEFLYYELSLGPKIISVIQISPSRRRPHIIKIDLGKVRNGQIPIRRGSSTDGIKLGDLIEFFYGQTSGYFPSVIQKLNLDVQQLQASTQYLEQLRQREKDLKRQMEIIAGVPPGTLG
jgi:predicted HTH transcriptional regulator